MKSKLLRLIFDYSINGKLVDKAFIEKLIDLVVNSKNIGEYIKDASIEDADINEFDDEILLAAYHPNKKIIKVYSNAIEMMLEMQDKYQGLFNGVEQIFYKNILITQVLLHELEHANQRRIIDKENTLESKILRISVTNLDANLISKLLSQGFTKEEVLYFIRERNKVRSENYLILPDERLAEIKSHQEIVSTLELIKEYTPNLIEFEKDNVFENLLRGYFYSNGKITSPTIEYAKASGQVETLKKFDWYSKSEENFLSKVEKSLSLEERLNYGLPIRKKEYSDLANKLLLSKKYQY